MGGGVGGINYACNGEGNELNYKHYNLRGDVIATTNMSGNILSEIFYDAYGNTTCVGTLPADKHRANTKVDDGRLILDGHRYRNKALMRFMSPDPLEYVDGFNCYIYCNNNPWGRFDALGLIGRLQPGSKNPKHAAFASEFNSRLTANLDGVHNAMETTSAAFATLPIIGAVEVAAFVSPIVASSAQTTFNSIASKSSKILKSSIEEVSESAKIASKQLENYGESLLKNFETGILNWNKMGLMEKANYTSVVAGGVSELVGIDTNGLNGTEWGLLSPIVNGFQLGGVAAKSIDLIESNINNAAHSAKEQNNYKANQYLVNTQSSTEGETNAE